MHQLVFDEEEILIVCCSLTGGYLVCNIVVVIN